MKITLIEIGKTKNLGLSDMIQDYTRRIQRFNSFEVLTIKESKATSSTKKELVAAHEASLIRKRLKPGDHLVLLDEKGTEFSSRKFAKHLEVVMRSNISSIVFVIGGAFGFDDSLKAEAAESISLSKMTYSHQLIRVVFLEQLYRAFSILNNHPYHND